MFKHLNVSSHEELSHILKCLDQDMIQDDNIISEEDIQKLCSGVDFGEEILENDPQASTLTILDKDFPLNTITLGDELNLSNILDNNEISNLLQDIDTNTLDTPTFDLNIDELLNQPCELSTQEVNDHMNNFLESDIARELEKVIEYLCS